MFMKLTSEIILGIIFCNETKKGTPKLGFPQFLGPGHILNIYVFLVEKEIGF